MFLKYRYLLPSVRAPCSRAISTLNVNRFLTSNLFVVLENPVHANAFIAVTDNLRLEIVPDKTLGDAEKELRRQGKLKSLNCYTYEGARISKSTKLETFLGLAYFKLEVDDISDYIIISEKSFSYNNQKYLLKGNVKKFFDYCKNIDMNDGKAVVLSRFCAHLESQIRDKPNLEGTALKETFLNRAQSVLVREAHASKLEAEILERNLELLEEQKRQMEVQINKYEKRAEIVGKRRVLTYSGIIFFQFLLSQYGTYAIFSWDIMEPLTCGMTLGDAIIAYLYWIATKTSYTLDNIFRNTRDKKKEKFAKRDGYSLETHRKTSQAIEVMKKRVQELKQ